MSTTPREPAAKGGAVFVLPTATVGQLGPVAAWISTSGWAAAAERQLGASWIVTRYGHLSIEEVRQRSAVAAPSTPDPARRLRRRVPPLVKTALKDVREAARARRFSVDPSGPWATGGHVVDFVWQRHELFHDAGLVLAAELMVPSVVFVPSVIVWQAEQWGVSRPGWGKRLEAMEGRLLRRATLVACGSEMVAEQVARLGVPEPRLLVTPTGVDLDLFANPIDRVTARRELGLGDGLVIGWIGSFRAFHDVDRLVDAAAALTDATLLLVGDGPERARVARRASDKGVRAHFTGVVPHDRLARVLAAMDVGVVVAEADAAFHYSPLKVAEYLAAGLPVVAPSLPGLANRLEPTGAAALYPPGDVHALSRLVQDLGRDPARRKRLGAAARAASVEWSWDRQVAAVSATLAGRPISTK